MRLDKLYKRNSNPELFFEEPDETNCGSFALNVTEWYTPYITDDGVDEDDKLYQYAEWERANHVYELFQSGHTAEEVMEDIIEQDFEFILKTCPWLVPIQEDEINYDEDRVIAYRLSLEVPNEVSEFDMDDYSDFHFRVLIDGEWWEKNGAGPVHKVEENEGDTWNVDDWLVYSGPIKYAKFKKEKTVC